MKFHIGIRARSLSQLSFLSSSLGDSPHNLIWNNLFPASISPRALGPHVRGVLKSHIGKILNMIPAFGGVLKFFIGQTVNIISFNIS